MTETHVHVTPELPWRTRIAIGVLAVLVAVGFGMLLWVILGPLHHGNVQRHQLACQVQRLGGKPIGGVHCPPSRQPQRHTTTGPTPTLTAVPGTTILVVPTPTAARPRIVRTSSTRPRSTPSERKSSSRPQHSTKPTPVACATAGPIAACVNKPL